MTKDAGNPNMAFPRFEYPATPISKVAVTERVVKIPSHFFLLPVRSIHVPYKGENITKKKEANAFAYEINVLAIWFKLSLFPTVSET